MNSKFFGIVCFVSGSLLTLMVVNLVGDTADIASNPGNESSAVKVVDSAQLNKATVTPTLAPAAVEATSPAAAGKTTVAADPVNRPEFSTTHADTMVEQQPSIAELEDNIYLHSVLPAVSQLGSILSLEPGQQDKIGELLQAKTNADLQSWHALQKLSGEQSPNPEQLNADYQQKAQQSAQRYNEELKKLLSPEQYQNYVRFERSQAEVRIQQQAQQLSAQLNKIGQLDEFQRQEISRLSAAVFSAADDILPGTSVSPYAPSPIRTNNDALEQLRSVFSESQLKEAGL